MKKFNLTLFALAITINFCYAQWVNGTGTVTTTTDKIGIGTSAPTHTLSLGSTSTGVAEYNTTDQTTNFERVRHFWNANVYEINAEAGGTGAFRAMRFFTHNTIRLSSPAIGFGDGYSSSVANQKYINVFNGSTASSGISNFFNVVPTINQSATAGYRALMISPYEQTTGSGFRLLIDAGINSAANGAGTHSPVFQVTNYGNAIISGRFGIGSGMLNNSPAAKLMFDGSAYSTSVPFSASGFGIRQDAATYTSTTTSGTIYSTGVNTFSTPTLATSAATTFTHASTFYINAAPVAGSNVTITTPWALFVNSGNSYFGGGVASNGFVTGLNLKQHGNNTFTGYLAGNSSLTGGNNTITGYNAAPAITTGSMNVIMGSNVAPALTAGDKNIILGTANTSWNNYTAQSLTTGTSNIIIGAGTAPNVSTGNNNIAIGNGAFGGTFNDNVAVGYQAGGGGGAGYNNTFLGTGAGAGNGTGNNNIFLGWRAGFSASTGNNLTVIGNNAGNIASGSNLTFIGNNAGKAPATSNGLTNATAIGYNAQVTTSNSLILGNGVNVGIGTTAPDSKLAVKGIIHAEEVKVDLNVTAPDYVFESDYKLANLTDIKEYVDKNHHLPEIPSAAQFAKEGINLSEMNMKLLKKVEELTLYLIDQQKQLKQQGEQINKMQKQLDAGK
jgi:trimeric autotransporter adhesin